MGEVVIKVEELSKQYRLGTVGTGTLSHDLNRLWARFRGKDDPYALVGDINNRAEATSSDYVWALRDISFELKQGEVLGVVGKNGAGKSTLLKILSRVTSPTRGAVKMRGRVGSLLEVGTGFHPELTGRENIFLNGAILGMRRWEIANKLNEIVDFSGVGKYLDTPVKRYSSGMKVRLGFAVAAHLEPEILIVDEVLAVGDAEFQKKCLGKMNEVSKKDGRSILFVSHNMSAVQNLCDRSLLLSEGMVSTVGRTDEVVRSYLADKKNVEKTAGKGGQKVEVCQVSMTNRSVSYLDEVRIKFEVNVLKRSKHLHFILRLEDVSGNIVFVSTDEDFEPSLLSGVKEGSYIYEACIPKKILKPGEYSVTFSVVDKSVGKVQHLKEGAIDFEVYDFETLKAMNNLYRDKAVVSPAVGWNLRVKA